VPCYDAQVVPAEFVPERASPESWRRHHDFRRRSHEEWRPGEPLEPDDVAQALLCMGSRFAWNHHWQFTLGSQVVSELGAETVRPESPEYETNRHLLWAWAWVLEPYRRRGIGRAWIPKVLDLMDEHSCTVLSMGADQESGHAFITWLGAEPKLRERESRLDLRQLDWQMVERWVRDGESASVEARLELHSRRLPDEILDEYGRASSELLNTMPFEDLDHGDIVATAEQQREWYQRLDISGSSHDVCLVRDPDGTIAGMTDVIQHPYEPEFVRQNFTGVHPRARGRGLGKWLKAKMLLHVRKAYPDALTVTTENAGSNAAMLAINHALGFKLTREVTYFQINRDRLAQAC
jgi:GNAT superfamily N-acetyltransferase